ncbi:hypothetical protein DXX93_03560 [Thalassotalea euphylliae]|uniref:Uncharacterized protein n=1 Tax=Thalassotalea euphylliae TaxID=1655234 RepID=A0A3E0TN90_9GAMM|nr:hypothetical protein [Thalassotalea euphylliae]REL25720.1 hypothetical protein DXX93_03560 [Thalassotalea euphylliae]
MTALFMAASQTTAQSLTKPSQQNRLSIMEQWLQVLLLSYQTAPQTQIIKYINYYLTRIIAHEECQACRQKHCQYLRMQKYWQWRLSADATG